MVTVAVAELLYMYERYENTRTHAHPHTHTMQCYVILNMVSFDVVQ